jgi:hypothetical protein
MTRAIFGIDRNDHTTYNEYIADQLREPDYTAVLQAIQQARRVTSVNFFT